MSNTNCPTCEDEITYEIMDALILFDSFDYERNDLCEKCELLLKEIEIKHHDLN